MLCCALGGVTYRPVNCRSRRCRRAMLYGVSPLRRCWPAWVRCVQMWQRSLRRSAHAQLLHKRACHTTRCFACWMRAMWQRAVWRRGGARYRCVRLCVCACWLRAAAGGVVGDRAAAADYNLYYIFVQIHIPHKICLKHIHKHPTNGHHSHLGHDQVLLQDSGALGGSGGVVQLIELADALNAELDSWQAFAAHELFDSLGVDVAAGVARAMHERGLDQQGQQQQQQPAAALFSGAAADGAGAAAAAARVAPPLSSMGSGSGSYLDLLTGDDPAMPCSRAASASNLAGTSTSGNPFTSRAPLAGGAARQPHQAGSSTGSSPTRASLLPSTSAAAAGGATGGSTGGSAGRAASGAASGGSTNPFVGIDVRALLPHAHGGVQAPVLERPPPLQPSVSNASSSSASHRSAAALNGGSAAAVAATAGAATAAAANTIFTTSFDPLSDEAPHQHAARSRGAAPAAAAHAGSSRAVVSGAAVRHAGEAATAAAHRSPPPPSPPPGSGAGRPSSSATANVSAGATGHPQGLETSGSVNSRMSVPPSAQPQAAPTGDQLSARLRVLLAQARAQPGAQCCAACALPGEAAVAAAVAQLLTEQQRAHEAALAALAEVHAAELLEVKQTAINRIKELMDRAQTQQPLQ